MLRVSHIKARDLPDAWYQLLIECYKNGIDKTVHEGSYAGQQRKELPYTLLQVSHPTLRPILPDVPEDLKELNPVPEGMKYIEEDYLPYIMTDDIKSDELYTYGNRMFGRIVKRTKDNYILGTTSQIDEIVEKYKRGFNNNQCCVSIAKPEDIYITDPPCMRTIRFSVTEASSHEYDIEYKLHMSVHFRSWDLFMGLPANLAGLVYLMEYICEMVTNMEESRLLTPGEFICNSEGLHLYDHAWPLAEAFLRIKRNR